MDRDALSIEKLRLARAPDFELRVDAFELAAGACALIAGASGAGKSSLLEAIVGVPRAGDPLRIEGSIRIGGVPRPRIGSGALRALLRDGLVALPQDARAALDPLRPLGEQIGEHGHADRAAVTAALTRLGIAEADEFVTRLPHQVSGGQAQRALLAIALCRRPALCLLDEPTAGLDAPRVEALAVALGALRDAHAGCALLIASHDARLATRLGAEVNTIRDGRLVRDATPATPWPPVERATEPGDELVAAVGLGLRFGARWVVRDFDLALHASEIVALLGPSGAGKTSVARALAGHFAPAAGRVRRSVPRTAVQMLFQDAQGSLTPGRAVGALCREVAANGFDVAGEAQRLGLEPALLERPVEELSGGERRRAALLRALAVRPRALLLDEPTANLDRRSAGAVLDLLADVRARLQVGMLWITHDDDLAAAVADRTVHIAESS